MKKRRTAHSGLFSLVLCATVFCSIISGTLLAFFRSGAPTKVHHASLTFVERVAYQRVIEEVYWRHRIWPKDNPGPKPPLDAVMSREQIEKKVSDYLRRSQLVADQRGLPITAGELQAEMERMTSHTLHPRVLLELFQALDNDPFVIAECLARPLVAGRLVNELTNGPQSSSFRAKSRNSVALPSGNSTGSFDFAQDDTQYKLPEIASLDCTDDTWTATSMVNVPDARIGHSAVWTGSEMIVWGGFNFDQGNLNTGGRYDPATDSWTATSIADAPVVRWHHSAVWTGAEMIVWGGAGNNELLNTGGGYNPVTDSWTATSTSNAPFARGWHTAVWTGNEMIIWGGYGCGGNCILNSGGRYDPSTNSWTATSTTNAPEARYYHTSEWTGSEMIVWGGTNRTTYLNTGGKYHPIDDSWTATDVPNDVLGRFAYAAVWTGSEMMVWGGVDSTFNDCNTGGRYNPTGDSWMPISTINAPFARDSHTAVWTGSEMVVWGGEVTPGMSLDTGGRYSTATDSWIATSIANVPHAREDHTAVWTGGEMIVWGGTYILGGNLFFLNTGGRYCAQAGPTATPTPTATTTATGTPTATATPTPTATATVTPTTTPASPTPAATGTLTPTSTPRPTPTPRGAPPARPRPTPPPRP